MRFGTVSAPSNRATSVAGSKRRPATVACAPSPAPALSRPSIASITCVATVRPKRASHACATDASSSSIVPTAMRSTSLALTASASTIVNVSSASSTMSSSNATRIVPLVCPGARGKGAILRYVILLRPRRAILGGASHRHPCPLAAAIRTVNSISPVLSTARTSAMVSTGAASSSVTVTVALSGSPVT